MSDETVNITGDDTAARLLLSAVATFVKDDEFRTKFASHGPVAKVELLVNGHRVPCAETLADAWHRMDEVLEARARRMAVAMVTEAGLEPLVQALRDAENNIREKLGIWE